MNKNNPLYLFFVILTVITSGCDTGIFDKRICEGVIEFQVTYPQLDPDDMLAGLMPDAMTMKFKDNVFNSELSAGMGMFKTNFICNSNAYTLTNSVKLVKEKFASVIPKKEVEKLNKKYDNVSIIHMDETKVIAGFKCKKALLIFEDIDIGDVYVFYTDDIKFKDPNWSTPFKDIDGILLEYQMERFDIKMHFTAINVKEQKLDDSDFILPEDYEHISQEALDEKIDAVFETFQ